MYCQKCGKKIEDNSKFCKECGAKILNDNMKGFDDDTTNPPFKRPFTKLGIAAIPIGALSVGYCTYGFAQIGSLTVGILFGILGTVFGCIALYTVLKQNKRNKLVAVLGFVLSVLGLVSSIICYCALPNSEAAKTPASNTTINITTQENNISTDGVPADYITAKNKAQSYSDSLHMSRQAIYDRLTSASGDNLSSAAADYALDNIKADYNNNALIKGQGYSAQGLTKDAIYNKLASPEIDKFTHFEAQYAVDNLK